MLYQVSFFAFLKTVPDSIKQNSSISLSIIIMKSTNSWIALECCFENIQSLGIVDTSRNTHNYKIYNSRANSIVGLTVTYNYCYICYNMYRKKNTITDMLNLKNISIIWRMQEEEVIVEYYVLRIAIFIYMYN